MNNKKLFIIIAAVLLIAVSGVVLYYSLRSNMSDLDMTMGNSVENSSLIDTNSDTYKQYAAMSGETYDRAFLANMIVHHQGAVDMAQLAITVATRQELKDLANNIISTQEQEMAQMTSWQKEWGFPSTSPDSMIDHGAMGMMDSMASMTSELEGKTGDEFNKAFIEQMIIHHQSAIDMAAPGEMNAQRQEIKDLSKEIISAQTKEIKQMRQWQQEWGYEN